jgi:hypothetical protein
MPETNARRDPGVDGRTGKRNHTGAIVVFLFVFAGFALLMRWHGQQQAKQQAAAQVAASMVTSPGMAMNINPATGFPFGSAMDNAVQGQFDVSTFVTQGTSAGPNGSQTGNYGYSGAVVTSPNTTAA